MIKGFAIKRIRLINFHNFIDETIEINGHLFLIGGNGSGKTTVLDAVHFVLTAGKYSMELNSAARMAGQPRTLGRTLQGIFLRYDLERGQRNNDKTIGYAVLEFEKPGSEERFCLGCGALATNLQTAPHIWGFEAPGRLDQLELTVRQGEEVFPVNQEDLKSRNCKVYNRDRYVEVIAEKFFDSRSSYRETMKLIAAGKSYRELVSRFQDQSQLFRELLPPPDEAGYHEIQSTLQDIEKMQADIEDQKARVDLLRNLAIELAEALKQRERIGRFAYMHADHRRQHSEDELKGFVEAEKKAQQELVQNRAAIEGHEQELSRITARVEILKDSDAWKSSLLLTELRSQATRSQAALQEVERRLNRQRAEISKLATQQQESRAQLESFWQKLCGQYEECRQLPDQADLSAPEPAQHEFRPQHQHLNSRLQSLRNGCAEESAQLEHASKERKKRGAELNKQISRLRAEKEAAPDAAGYTALEQRLTEGNIEFVPFFKTIEPAAEMSDALGRVIEEIVGPQRLCAILVAGNQQKKAQAAGIAEAYNVPVIDACENLPPSPAPGGLRRFLTFKGDFAAAAETYAAVILDAYRHVYSDEELLHSGESNMVSAGGLVREDGSLRRVDATTNRFVGTAARESTRREQIAILQAQAEEEAAALKTLHEGLDAVRSRQNQIGAMIEALSRISPEMFSRYQHEIEQLVARIKAADELRQEDEAQVLTLERERAVLEEKINAIAQTAESADYEATEAELAQLARAKKEREDLLSQCRCQQGRLENTIENTRQEMQHAAGVLEKRKSEFSAQQARLLSLLTEVDEGSLRQYVYVTQRGQQLKPENCEARLREGEREFAGQQQKIESLLQHNTILQRDFSFAFDKEALVIQNRDGNQLAELARQHQQSYDEACAILDAKNRKLFEDIIFRDIVHRLCREEETLNQTIRQMNALLSELKFGNTVYSFKMQLRSEFKEFRELIRKVSLTDEVARGQLRDYFDAHRQSLVREGSELPDFLDYRKWHDVVLQARSVGASKDVILSRRQLSMGSGGEQSVPNYILLLSLAKVHLDHTRSRIRIILMDEAFYGIDPQRRDELLSFADRLDLCLIIAHPELDGVTEAMSNTTTLLVEKTHAGDIYLGKCDFTQKKPQGLFDEPPPPPDAVISTH
ncbi:MAG: hypothetical protein CVV41_21775 [Candidatus Riflebacteria bacterium HGW-Riflebacteria-1]|jgi:DNA repair exonuclease SbcCD ATPase subunit|nr:MAG: hypothetical protein CVV41_21775 [Candidatus Riflebacteria bacterium HGW-Riflebacteria-1]